MHIYQTADFWFSESKARLVNVLITSLGYADSADLLITLWVTRIQMIGNSSRWFKNGTWIIRGTCVYMFSICKYYYNYN